MTNNNLIHCKAITYNSDIIATDIYFVHESDRMIHHRETLDELVEQELQEEVDFHERSGYEMEYQEKVEMRNRIEEELEGRYIVHITNQMRIFHN